MTSPKISVITPSLNQGEFLRDAIDSVLRQDYPNLEHIVVDGGSSDGSVEILRCYPDLRWTSAPDDGQADALNRGFARAQGEIVAWLNADDYYAPGAFAAVAEALRSQELVMGKCQLVDRHGIPTELVPNIEHSWFDILKYWIYDSIPTQPSIFFRRTLLEDVRRADGSYLDPDLDFCMDYDLWLRMARRQPFTTRIDRTLSYYRIYENNKTGGDWDLIFKEASRVFARHTGSDEERRLSMIVPLGEAPASEALEVSLGALDQQSHSDFEVVLVDVAPFVDRRAFIYGLAQRHPGLSVRYLRAAASDHQALFDCAAHRCRGRLLALLRPGWAVPPDFCLFVSQLFVDDSVGAALLHAGDTGLSANGLSTPLQQAEWLLTAASIPPLVAMRRVALREVLPLAPGRPLAFTVRELLLRTLFKGWRLHVGQALPVQPHRARTPAAEEAIWVAGGYLGAMLIHELERAFESEPMAAVREAHGACVRFPRPMVASAREVLAALPRDLTVARGAEA